MPWGLLQRSADNLLVGFLSHMLLSLHNSCLFIIKTQSLNRELFQTPFSQSGILECRLNALPSECIVTPKILSLWSVRKSLASSTQ